MSTRRDENNVWDSVARGENQHKEVVHERCSCGSRQKSKCVKESGLQAGKMCLKAEVSIMDISTEKSIQISERGREKILDEYYDRSEE